MTTSVIIDKYCFNKSILLTLRTQTLVLKRMDQPKMERMLRIMQCFSGNTLKSLDEIARDMGVSKRSLFRYIDTFKNAGFVVNRVGEGVYRMTTNNKCYSDLSQLVYFTEEEAILVSHLIEDIDNSNVMKEDLKEKLRVVYGATAMANYLGNKGNAENVTRLVDAIKGKKQVMLKDYSSSCSDTTKDFLLEPYKLGENYVDMWAYDVKSGSNKLFKISRIGSVNLLGPWEHEDQHQFRPKDAFRMSGKGDFVEHVKLKLTLRAKNLLYEEYPLSRPQLYQVKRTWFWEGDVYALEGVGRFVLGLAEDITILEGDRLREYTLARAAKVLRRKGV